MDTNYTQHVRLSDQISNLNDSLAVIVGSENSNFNPGLVPNYYFAKMNKKSSTIYIRKVKYCKIFNIFLLLLDLLYYIAQYYFMKNCINLMYKMFKNIHFTYKRRYNIQYTVHHVFKFKTLKSS